MRILTLAAILVAAAPIATAADARPIRHGFHHRHERVCRTVFRHGHRITRCVRR